MTLWREPAWQPGDLVPGRIWSRGGFSRSVAEVQSRGADAGASWGDALPHAGAGDAMVLVGGAGFLGARIAAQLLDADGDAPVVVVSRRPAALRGHWRAFLPPATADRLWRSPRLRLLAADAAAPGLGWAQAVPRAAVVMHLAAEVNALAGWDRLAQANLHALRAAVALARRDGALLQLASTLSLFVSASGGASGGAEALPPADDVWLHGGYAQTKAAAEAALAVAGDGLRWQCLRYGLLVPEAGRAFPPGHFAPAFAQAVDAIGSLPDAAETAEVDLTPVDQAAAMAIRIALSGQPGHHHVANPVPARLAEVVAAIEARRGPLAVVPRERWLQAVDSLSAVPRTLLRAAFAKSLFLAEDAARAPVLNVDLFQATRRRFGSAAVLPTPAALLPGVAASMLEPAA